MKEDLARILERIPLNDDLELEAKSHDVIVLISDFVQKVPIVAANSGRTYVAPLRGRRGLDRLGGEAAHTPGRKRRLRPPN